MDAVFQIMKGNPSWNLEQVKDEVFSQISQGIVNMDIASTKIDHTREKEVGIAGNSDNEAMEINDMDFPIDYLPPYHPSEAHQPNSTVDPNVRGSLEIEDPTTLSNRFSVQPQTDFSRYPSTNCFENVSDDMRSMLQTQPIHRHTGAFSFTGILTNPQRSGKFGPQNPSYVAQSSDLGLPRTPRLFTEDAHVILLLQ